MKMEIASMREWPSPPFRGGHGKTQTVQFPTVIDAPLQGMDHSTVTLFARFLGWSISQPRNLAT
jgi:hypothetical protein